MVTYEVTADFGTPSGTVTVTAADGTENCTGVLTDGVGDCEITLGETGVYTLTATYSGDDDFLPSSIVEEHTVAPARLFLPLVVNK